MRIDHYAYQQATRVAGIGLLLQLLIGVTLFIFGQLAGDTSFVFGSMYVVLGVLVWLSLIIVFYQHNQERLEALEETELAQTRGEVESVFDTSGEDIRVAARRLRLMHKWFMPAVSLLLALLMAVLGWWILTRLNAIKVETLEFRTTDNLGWAIAICLGYAVVAFIFSRFVAGMSKQPAWQNLRGGAGYMVGNALVLLALAVGIAFRFFDNDAVLAGIAYAIPAFMFVVAAEILLNFILNLYRPRIPGEVPRPAFDSKLLSLLAAPDNLVRSINEAINYQVGFDITSSWGYQLFLRSLAGLVILGVVVMVGLTTLVVVEPDQQGIKLAGGKIVGDVRDSGPFWKLPWPLETAKVYDVSEVRRLPLTAQFRLHPLPPNYPTRVYLWSNEMRTDTELVPFIVGATTMGARTREPIVEEIIEEAIETEEEAEAVKALSRSYSLLNAEINLLYRIKSVETGSGDNGLLDYLRFASDDRQPRQLLTERERILRAIALREVTQYFSANGLDELLGELRYDISPDLVEKIQIAFDRHRTGVDVVDVDIHHLRPPDDAIGRYVDLAISKQARQQMVTEAERGIGSQMAYFVGSMGLAERLVEEINDLDQLRRELGEESPQVKERALEIESMILDGGGAAAQMIRRAERDKWVNLLASRAEMLRVNREIPVYRAAPEIYRQREFLEVIDQVLGNPMVRKYVLTIDPDRFNLDVELTELNVPLNFGDTLADDDEVSQ